MILFLTYQLSNLESFETIPWGLQSFWTIENFKVCTIADHGEFTILSQLTNQEEEFIV